MVSTTRGTKFLTSRACYFEDGILFQKITVVAIAVIHSTLPKRLCSFEIVKQRLLLVIVKTFPILLVSAVFIICSKTNKKIQPRLQISRIETVLSRN